MNNKEFVARNKRKIKLMSKDRELERASRKWFLSGYKYEYSYHFTWLGRPIIQYPQDIIAIQEIIWKVKPDLIIEIGIARGGSIVFSASILELIGSGKVLGIDIDIRKENRLAIEKHPLAHRIAMFEGSSIDSGIIKKVHDFARKYKKIMLILDSNHTHKHVLKEMTSYSDLVSKGSYMVVMDTIIEDMNNEFFTNRSWSKGNNPKTAVFEFLRKNTRFKVDKEIEDKLLITVAPHGFLRCIKK